MIGGRARVLWLAPWMRSLARVEAEAMQRRGVDVLLVTTDRNPEPDAARDYELVLDPRFRAVSTWPSHLAAWRRIRRYRPDVVITEPVGDPRWIALAGRVPRVQLVYDDDHYADHYDDRWGARSAATVTFSDYVAARIAARRDVAGTPLRVVPLTSDLDPQRVPPPPAAQDRRNFVMVGRGDADENIDVVLRAWRRHVTGGGWRGDDLVLVGDGPPAGHTFSGALPAHTRWFQGGYRCADVIAALSAAKGSVAHYRRVSQSAVQVLSMQLGVTPIVSEAGALPEYQPPGCWPVGIDDVAGLAAAFDALADPATAARWGAAAHQHYLRWCGADRATDALLSVLTEVLDAHRPRSRGAVTLGYAGT